MSAGLKESHTMRKDSGVGKVQKPRGGDTLGMFKEQKVQNACSVGMLRDEVREAGKQPAHGTLWRLW